jgi:hypothetical protein
MDPNQQPQPPMQQPPPQQQPGGVPAPAPQGAPQQGAPQQPNVPQPGQTQQPGQNPPNQQLGALRTNPNSTQNTLLMSEVRDGIVIMHDGSFRAVIMTKSINFDLMSPEEREAVEYAYQGFINSLYFPIQIFIRSSKVDIRPYMEKLAKVRAQQDNMLLGLLTDDYIDYITALAQETNIMDKKFYIVIPYYAQGLENAQQAIQQSKGILSNITGGGAKNQQGVVTINEETLEKSKQELKNRVQAVLSGLNQLGVQGIPLDTEELIELYYDAYNPDTATRQSLGSVPADDLTAPVVTKGQGNARNPNLDGEIF